MAVAGAAFGEVAQEETLDAGHSYGQCLDVFAQADQVAADVASVSTNVRSEVLDVGAKCLPQSSNVGTDRRAKASDIGSDLLTQALDFRADFGAKGAEVTTHLVPVRNYQRGQTRAYGQGCDEIR